MKNMGKPSVKNKSRKCGIYPLCWVVTEL